MAIERGLPGFGRDKNRSEGSAVDAKERVKAPLAKRNDIDGLRAIAVLLVLLFHGGSSIFPSGFVGVDVFFVISGFLITSILIRDLESGNFSALRFYERRMWRLQPAILALFAMTAALASVIYLPVDFQDYLKSGKYASMFLSNQYFERVTTAYAADDSASLLLLHTWSLAIEWQWYLLLPVSLVVLFRYLPRHLLPWVMATLTILAGAGALLLGSHQPDKSYYFFTSRVFELLIGACLVVFQAEKIRLTKLVATVVAVMAILVLAYCATRTGMLQGYPDYHGLLVSLATAALLIEAVGLNGMHARILGSSPLRAIGLVSYSLYLWHWPILAVISYLGLKTSQDWLPFYYIGSFALAVLSYFLIEKRFRYTKLGFYKSLAILVIGPALLFSLSYKLSDKQGGWPGRFGQEYAASVSKINAYASENRRDCIDDVQDPADPHCHVGAANATKRGLLIGDSFSNQYWGFVDVLAKDAGVSVAAISTSACLALPDVYLFNWWKYKDVVYQKCHDNVAAYYQAISANHYDYVMLGQIWENYAGGDVVMAASDQRSVELSQARVVRALRSALSTIVSSGAIPVVIKAVATMPPGVNECLSQPLKMRGLFDSKEQAAKCTVADRSTSMPTWFDGLFDSLKADYPTLVVIDPKVAQCVDSKCANVVDGAPVYRDVGHITDYASYKFGRDYIERMGNPLKGPK
jgi:peptidoglycan/LPS O-acetylase OafA/YrhL